MLLPRWNPVGEVISYQDEMDPVFEQELARALNSWPEPVEIDLPIHFKERDDDTVMDVDLRGVNVEGLKVTISGHTLKIKGEFKTEHENELDHASYGETAARKFVRFIDLPASIKPARINTRIKGHFLRIRVPKGTLRT